MDVLYSVYPQRFFVSALRHEKSYPPVRFSHLFLLSIFASAARSPFASSRFWKPPIGTHLLHVRVRYLMRAAWEDDRRVVAFPRRSPWKPISALACCLRRRSCVFSMPT